MALKFKRQKRLGPCIVDSVCLELGWVIEVDGGEHGSSADERRDRWFRARRYTVLRFWNNEVLGQTETVLERVRLAVLALSPNPRPGPIQGGSGAHGSADPWSASAAAGPASGRGGGERALLSHPPNESITWSRFTWVSQ